MHNINQLRIKLAAAALAAAPVVLAPQAQAQLGSVPLPVTTNVTVTNPVLNVHSVDNHALNAVTADGQLVVCTTNQRVTFPLGTPGSLNGEVMVVQQVNARFRMAAGTFPAYGVRIQTQGNSGLYTMPIPAALQGSDALWNFYVASQAVTMYSTGGEVDFVIDEGATAGAAANKICLDEVSVSGYTVPNK